jgi:hypothetical protein
LAMEPGAVDQQIERYAYLHRASAALGLRH